MRIPHLEDVTMTLDDRQSSAATGADPLGPGLTVLWHPDVRRVGDRVAFLSPSTDVSRVTPTFEPPRGGPQEALADPYVSRKVVRFTRRGDQIEIDPGEARPVVDGVRLEAPTRFDAQAIARGVPIELSRRVLLMLHMVPLRLVERPTLGLVGESAAIQELRAAITKVAEGVRAVLIRGESGSGKELVARAVHQASARARGPYRSVNAAAVPDSVAASAFFGHTKGAFSGADKASDGYFGDSHEGTLFLDEIGDLPKSIQPLLLRALESGEVQPVGATRTRIVDVRIIAATDANLDDQIDRGRFSAPLMHRLNGFEIWVPPLRQRPDDIPRLLVHFLRSALSELGAADRLYGDPTARKPWLDASLVAMMVRYRWPGNVRELLNTAEQIAFHCRDRSRVRPAHIPTLARMADAEAAQVTPSEPLSEPTSEPSGSLSETMETPLTVGRVLDALGAAGWSVHAAARTLGVPKTTLYRFIDAHRLLRKAGEIPDAELRTVFAECGGDRGAMSDRLRVSIRALTFRLKELDPPPSVAG